MANTYIGVNVWGSPPQVYPKTAQFVELSCNHTRIGTYIITTTLQVLPLPDDTELISAGGASSFTYPVQKFANLNEFPQTDGVRKVVLVLDHTTNVQYYVDYTSYINNIANCNPLPYVSACDTVSNLAASSITSTGATITFTNVGGASGYEWINKTTNVTPVINGTFDMGSPIVLTGLTTATTYYFFIRTVCVGGLESAWTSVSFATS